MSDIEGVFLAVSPNQLNAISMAGWQQLPSLRRVFCQPQTKLELAQKQAQQLYQKRHGEAYVVRLNLSKSTADQNFTSEQDLSEQQRKTLNQRLINKIELMTAFNS